MITVNSRSFDGTVRKSWQCELIEQRDSLLVCVGEFDQEIRHPDLGVIQKGTVSYEYYWLDRWYNIFRFHQPDGSLRSFYCNLTMPPEFADNVLDYVDLDFDVVVGLDGHPRILDRDEYERHSEQFGYPKEVHARVDAALEELLELFRRREMPGVPELFATSHAA